MASPGLSMLEDPHGDGRNRGRDGSIDRDRTYDQCAERSDPSDGFDPAWRTPPPLDDRAEADDRGPKPGPWRIADRGCAAARHQHGSTLHLAARLEGSAAKCGDRAFCPR